METFNNNKEKRHYRKNTEGHKVHGENNKHDKKQ